MKNDPNDIKAAERSAEYLIKYRMRSEKEMFYRLKQKGYNEEVILQVIEKLKLYKMIDDEVFAYSFAYDKITITKKGVNFIINELKNLGVNEYIIYDTINKIKNEINIYEIAYEIAKEKYAKDLDIYKVKNWLYRRGFETSIIDFVIQDLQK